MQLKFYIVLLCFGLVATSCRKDEIVIIEEEEGNNENPKVYHNASLFGRVTKEDGSTIEGAQISVLNRSSQTDDSGTFSLFNAKLNADGALVKSLVKGYLPAYRSLIINKNDVGSLLFIHKTYSTLVIVDSAEPRNYQVTDDISVFAGSNFFEWMDGQPYTGKVTLVTQPLGREFVKLLPLSVAAVNQNLKQGVLKMNFGMAVFAYADNGEMLRLKEDSALEVSWEEEGFSACEACELYGIDEANEVWRENPIESLEGSTLRFSVKELGYKVYGVQGNKVKVSGHLVDKDGAAVPDMKIQISNGVSGYYFRPITGSDGRFQTILPGNENFDVQIYSKCGDLIYSGNLQTSSSDDFAQELKMSNSATHINFDLFDCAFNAIDPQTPLIAEVISGVDRSYARLDDNTVEFNGLMCDGGSIINILDGDKILLSRDLTENIVVSNEVDLYRAYICEEDYEGLMQVEGARKYLNPGELVILEEPVGSGSIEFTDLSGFSVIVDGVVGVGTYVPKLINFIEPSVVNCEVGLCNEVEVRIVDYGANKGDVIEAHVFGTVNGKRIDCYFNGNKYN